ncbi:MATE efflux family protein [Rhizoctonia solani]|uniref:MATE efflux family protein n=1 Tax=Rhizoctonia solani TaxID=456999 RepID=A0A8H8SZB7_9AGAM|nr:MATE efflux family protein [Rhizoctonia solani]QRW23429.1 MATE efflux family protein [Rhizoctonia solani]
MPATLPKRNHLGGTSVPRIDEEGDDKEEDEAEPSWTERLQESKVLLKYTAPVFATHLLEYSLVIASVISIGHLSTEGLAASTLGSMTARGPVITHGTWARTQRMVVVMSFTIIPILCVWHSAESILLVLRQEPEIARLAGIYLKWLSIGLPAYFQCCHSAQGLMHVPSLIIGIIAPINALLNWILVWGPQPIRLGFVGAPLATAISFNLIAVCSVAYGLLYTPGTAWHPIGRRSFRSLGTLVQLGLAGTGQIASEWWSWELVGLAASQLGPVALAAQSVLLVSSSTSYQRPLRWASPRPCESVICWDQATEKKQGLRLKFFLVFRKRWGYLFNNDETVIRLVGDIMPLVALFQIVDGMNAVTGGALRARGKQSLGALVNVTAYYVVGIPLGIYLAFWWNMELRGLWIGLATAFLFGRCFGTRGGRQTPARDPYSPSFYSYDPYELQRIRQAEEHRRRIEELNRRRAEQLEYARRQAEYERRREAEARYRRQQEIEARRRKFSEPAQARPPRVRLTQPLEREGGRPQSMFGGDVQDLFDALYGDRTHRNPSSSYGRRAKSSDSRARQKRVDPIWTPEAEMQEPEGSAVSDTGDTGSTVVPVSIPDPSAHATSESTIDVKTEEPSAETNQSQSAISDILKSFSDLKSSFTFPEKLDFLNSPDDADAVTPKLAYTRNNAPLHQQEHLLMGLLTKLDAVESYGQETIRKARKDAVLLIERELEELDVKKLQKWREQFKDVSTATLRDVDTEMAGTAPELTLETQPEVDPASIPLPRDEDCEPHSPTNVTSVASSDSVVTPIAQDSDQPSVLGSAESGKREVAQEDPPVSVAEQADSRTGMVE